DRGRAPPPPRRYARGRGRRPGPLRPDHGPPRGGRGLPDQAAPGLRRPLTARGLVSLGPEQPERRIYVFRRYAARLHARWECLGPGPGGRLEVQRAHRPGPVEPAERVVPVAEHRGHVVAPLLALRVVHDTDRAVVALLGQDVRPVRRWWEHQQG